MAAVPTAPLDAYASVEPVRSRFVNRHSSLRVGIVGPDSTA